MIGFYFGDAAEGSSHIHEAFLFSYVPEVWVERSPLKLFSRRCCLKVFRCRRDYPCWVRSVNLHHSALEMLKEQCCVLLFVVRSFLENSGYLLIARFFGFTSKESVSGPCLRFACECG